MEQPVHITNTNICRQSSDVQKQHWLDLPLGKLNLFYDIKKLLTQ